MSIASEISRLQSAKADLKTSIENKGVTVPASAKLDDYADYVDSIQTGGGGGGSATDPVRFIDYDGTILYSYSAEDFANLTEMPANPTHTGLTSQGWNWSLADAKAQVTAMGNCDIGQMYITNDGKTRIYISLVDSVRLSPYLGLGVNGTVVVDWGDNTTTDTLTGGNVTIVQRAQHTYASTGDYVITLTATVRTFAIFGTTSSSNGSYLLTRTNGSANSQRCYQNAIKKIELGADVSLGNNAFAYCHSLSSVTIPSGVTSMGDYAFQYCSSLKSLTIPSGVTEMGDYTFRYCGSLANVSIPSSVANVEPNAFYCCYSLSCVSLPSGVPSVSNYMFYNCYSIARITIPSSVTTIGTYTFYSCWSLSSMTIPSGVTDIGVQAFYQCYPIAEYHFLSTTPPTLENTNAFSGILSDCKIYVPAASLTAYQEATNWSYYASYMVGE